MTPDPLAAVLDQLAACREHLTDLDAREAAHHAELAGSSPSWPAWSPRSAAPWPTTPPPWPAWTPSTGRSPSSPGASPTDGDDSDGEEGYQPRPAPAWWKLAPDERRAPVAELRDWVEHVYRPGYGHLAAASARAGPSTTCACTGSTSPASCGAPSTSSPSAAPACCRPRPSTRPASCPPSPPSWPPRPPAATTPPPPTPGAPRDATRSCEQALACAERGWPVFPCQPGRKTPATGTATSTPPPTPTRSASGSPATPGRTWPSPPAPPAPTSSTSTTTAPPAAASPPSPGCDAAGLLDGAAARVRTPSGGLHLYFAGSDQRTGHLPASHIDFLRRGRLRPHPALAGRRQAVPARSRPSAATAAWTGTPPPASWNPPASTPAGRVAAAPQEQVSALARWVAAQREGNRNAGLFWAANRALETDQAADLSPLAAAARQAGLDDPEITRTLNSARRTSQARPEPPDRQAEGEH